MKNLKTSDLLGTWNLLAFDLEDPQGVRKPWGTNVKGRLVYLAEGFMSVAINKEIKSESEATLPQDTLDAMLFYSGKFSIEDSTIHHLVDLASDPERVGQDLVRYAKLDGKKMELSSPSQPWGRGIILWEKVQ